jgi:hypothetical protein
VAWLAFLCIVLFEILFGKGTHIKLTRASTRKKGCSCLYQDDDWDTGSYLEGHETIHNGFIPRLAITS